MLLHPHQPVICRIMPTAPATKTRDGSGHQPLPFQGIVCKAPRSEGTLRFSKKHPTLSPSTSLSSDCCHTRHSGLIFWFTGGDDRNNGRSATSSISLLGRSLVSSTPAQRFRPTLVKPPLTLLYWVISLIELLESVRNQEGFPCQWTIPKSLWLLPSNVCLLFTLNF